MMNKILEAYFKGQLIQFCFRGKWYDVDVPHLMNFNQFQWRIKP